MKSLFNKDSRTFDIVIGQHSKISGDLESEGSIRIDGKHHGNIKTTGDVIISQDAEVQGNIESDNIEIYGNVVGNVTVEGFIEVFDSGSLKGDLQAKGFNISEGGVFQGHCAINTKAEKKTIKKDENKNTHGKENNKHEKNDKDTKEQHANDKHKNNHNKNNHKSA